jgi:hypothetical protein
MNPNIKNSATYLVTSKGLKQQRYQSKAMKHTSTVDYSGALVGQK